MSNPHLSNWLSATILLAPWILFPMPTGCLAGSPETEITLKVQSVTVTRATSEFAKKFVGQDYTFNRPGVYMQFALAFDETAIEPCKVDIDSFVDDAHQDLKNTSRATAPHDSFHPSAISVDGHNILFSVESFQPPAENAKQMFLHGTLHARVVRGRMITATNHMMLAVGQETTVGEFQTKVREIADPDPGGPGSSNIKAIFLVRGDVLRLKRLRIIGADGLVLNDERYNRISTEDWPLFSNGDTLVQVSLFSMPTSPVTLEYTYPEKVEPVSIPFEAQVDVSVAKAGPLRSSN